MLHYTVGLLQLLPELLHLILLSVLRLLGVEGHASEPREPLQVRGCGLDNGHISVNTAHGLPNMHVSCSEYVYMYVQAMA